MTIDDVLEDKELLKRNAENLKANIPPTRSPGVGLKKTLETVFTTHTFGYEKIIPLFGDPDEEIAIYPYKSILFEDKALLSEHCRRSLDSQHHDSVVRTMKKARNYGLDKFVFTYLGAHEYYYSRSRGVNMPAFGVFLSSKLDNRDEKANATMYDLESHLVAGRDPSELTLAPSDARDITGFEIANRYDDKFHDYWCGLNYETKNGSDESWASKREFHYYDKVSIEHIEAIIWPIQKGFDAQLGQFVVRADISDDIRKFRKNHSRIHIYPYEWNSPEGKDRFHYASFLVVDEFQRTQKYLHPDSFRDSFASKFPAW